MKKTKNEDVIALEDIIPPDLLKSLTEIADDKGITLKELLQEIMPDRFFPNDE